MHEIRATLPPEHVGTATRLAREAGIDRISGLGRLCSWPRRKGGRSSAWKPPRRRRGLLSRRFWAPPRSAARRLFADLARAEGDCERRGYLGLDAAHERTVPRRDPGPLATEPSHDQLRRAGGGRRDPSRDRHSSTTIPSPSSSRLCFCPFSRKFSPSASAFGAATGV